MVNIYLNKGSGMLDIDKINKDERGVDGNLNGKGRPTNLKVVRLGKRNTKM